MNNLAYIFEIFINIIEALELTYLYSKYLKVNNNIIFILFVLESIIITIAGYIDINYIVEMWIYIVLDIIILKVITNNDLVNIFMITLICNVLTPIANITTGILMCIIFRTNMFEIFSSLTYVYMLMLILSKLLFFILIKLFLKLKNDINDLVTKYSMMMSVILLLMYLVNYYFITLFYKSKNLEYSLIITILMFFVLELLFVYLSCKIKIDYDYQLQLQTISNKVDSMNEQFALFNNSSEKIAILRHDLRNILISIKAYIENDEKDQAIKCIDDKMNTIDFNKSLIITGNTAIDCVINSYNSTIEKENITFVNVINKNNLDKIDEMDMAIIISNMLSNAIENISEKDKYIELNINSNDQSLIINVINSVDGDVITSNPKLLTKKDNKNIHGFGIKSIKNICNKYHGNFEYKQDNNMFICSAVLYF